MSFLRNWLKGEDSTYKDGIHRNKGTQPEADKWIFSNFIIKQLIPIIGYRPYPVDEQLLMCSTLAFFKPDMILEWGTHHGKSARIFFEIAKFVNFQTIIHSIDLPPDANHNENIHDINQRGVFVRDLPIQLHEGDGLTMARKLLKENNPTLPLFFVDGDHSFASVRNELFGIKEIAPYAIVLCHDTFFQEKESNYNCGPYEALIEFTKFYQLPCQSTVLGLPGMSLTYWI